MVTSENNKWLKIWDNIWTLKEVYDFTRRTVCASDVEAEFVKWVYVDRKKIENPIYADELMWVVVNADKTLITWMVSIDFDTEACVKVRWWKDVIIERDVTDK